MSGNSNRNRSVLICLGLAVVTAAVFWQVYRHDFISYDDNIYVYSNPNIQTGITLQSIKWVFTTGCAGNWHPLTWLSHMLDWQLYEDNPAGHHITNLIFHIANTLLLFIVLKRMTKALWPSAFVAALFALHPLHVESVAWVAERKDVLSTFFWLLTMWAYVRFVCKPKVGNYLSVVLFFVLGLMSKPMLVTLPFVLLLMDYWPLCRISFKDVNSKAVKSYTKSTGADSRLRTVYRLVLEKVPLFVITAVSSVVAIIAQQGSGAVMPIALVSLKLRIFNVLTCYVKYIGKMIWPRGLGIFYPYRVWDLNIWPAVVSLVLLLVITILVLYLAKKHRYLLVGWLWYVGTLLPVIGLVQVGSQSMADRYSYVTLIGLFIMIAWGVPELLEKWRYKRIILSVAGVLIISAMSVCTFLQLRYWRNNITLFQHTRDVTDRNYRAHLHLARALYKQNRFGEAVREYKNFIQIIPDNASVLNILGFALIRLGNLDEAIRYLNESLRIEGDFAKAHTNLGYALDLKGNLNEARLHLSEAVRLDPNLATAHYRLGGVLMRTGEMDKAVTYFDESLRLNPDRIGAMNDLAWYLATSEKTKVYNPERAIELAQRACELSDYNEATPLDTLAVAYAAMGDFSSAIETAEKAKELCQSSGQEALKGEIENRLILYKAGKAYIESR